MNSTAAQGPKGAATRSHASAKSPSHVRCSNRPCVSSTFRHPRLQCRCRSRARASTAKPLRQGNGLVAQPQAAFPPAGMRGIGECWDWDGAGANCLIVWPVARAVLGRRNESLTRCSWTGRQAGSNAAQRILKASETESRPHAGTYIEASTTKRPTIKQTTALVTSEAQGQPPAQDSSHRVCM